MFSASRPRRGLGDEFFGTFEGEVLMVVIGVESAQWNSSGLMMRLAADLVAGFQKDGPLDDVLQFARCRANDVCRDLRRVW